RDAERRAEDHEQRSAGDRGERLGAEDQPDRFHARPGIYTSRRMARVKLSVENELATELGQDRDAMLRALAERAGVEAYLRGNELTLDGGDDAVERARSVMVERAQLVAEGVSVGPQTVDAVAGVLTEDGRAVDVLHDVVWTHRGKQVSPK